MIKNGSPDPARPSIGSHNPFSLKSGMGPLFETCIVRKSGPMTDPQTPSPSEQPDADDVERHACPKCDTQPGSSCRSRSGAVASAYHTRRFTMVPRLKKALRVPTPADRRPGQPWRPGTPPPALIDADLPSQDSRMTKGRKWVTRWSRSHCWSRIIVTNSSANCCAGSVRSGSFS